MIEKSAIYIFCAMEENEDTFSDENINILQNSNLSKYWLKFYLQKTLSNLQKEGFNDDNASGYDEIDDKIKRRDEVDGEHEKLKKMFSSPPKKSNPDTKKDTKKCDKTSGSCQIIRKDKKEETSKK